MNFDNIYFPSHVLSGIHRASTELRQTVQSLAADLACPHVLHPSAWCHSFPTVRLQVISSLFYFLLPSGVHVSAVFTVIVWFLS